MVKEPNIARLRDNWACHDVVRISYRPLWPWPVNGPLWSSKILCHDQLEIDATVIESAAHSSLEGLVLDRRTTDRLPLPRFPAPEQDLVRCSSMEMRMECWLLRSWMTWKREIGNEWGGLGFYLAIGISIWRTSICRGSGGERMWMKEMAQCGTARLLMPGMKALEKLVPRRERVEPWSAHRSL